MNTQKWKYKLFYKRKGCKKVFTRVVEIPEMHPSKQHFAKFVPVASSGGFRFERVIE